MKTRKETITKIAQRRALMVLDPYSRFYDDAHFDDAAAVNRIAETYGGTYTEAWDEVRKEFRHQLKECA